eukprot:6555547-Prymnesium_polylepis.1
MVPQQGTCPTAASRACWRWRLNSNNKRQGTPMGTQEKEMMALTLLPLSMLSEAMKDDLPTPETAVAQSPDANEKEVAERR